MKGKIAVLLSLMLLLTLAACSANTDSQDVEWTISIEGVGEDTINFTNLDVEKVGVVTEKMAMKDKDSTLPEEEWEGVSLEDLLKHHGVETYTTVKVEAADGYAKEYTPDLVATSKALLGLKVNGEELDEERGPVQLAVNGKGPNWWIKNVTKITVIK